MLGSGEKQLSDMNVLLPLQLCEDCRRAKKLVTATNGCYKWQLSHSHALQMQEIRSKSHPECANVVEISNNQLKPSQNVVWLTARDQSSNQVLTAHIKFGKISRLQIDTHMRQVDNGAKVHLKAVGIDAEGNRLSTLDGLHFDWQVETGHEHIRILKDEREHHLQTHGYLSHDGA